MDGYIKNKKEAIASVKKTILYNYAITCLILIFIPLWLLGLLTNVPPEKWTHIKIVFSHISKETIGLRQGLSHVLNSQDGEQFVIKTQYVSLEELSNRLIPGNTYDLVFSETIAGGNHIKALSDENITFQYLDDSVSRWKKEQKGFLVAIGVTLVVEIVALVLIDRLGCKKEYATIRKLKADIKRREDRINNKKTRQEVYSKKSP